MQQFILVHDIYNKLSYFIKSLEMITILFIGHIRKYSCGRKHKNTRVSPNLSSRFISFLDIFFNIHSFAHWYITHPPHT